MGDELDEGIPHEPAGVAVGGGDVNQAVDWEGAAQLETVQHLDKVES